MFGDFIVPTRGVLSISVSRNRVGEVETVKQVGCWREGRGDIGLRYPVLTNEQLDEEITPVLKGLRPGPILRDFFLHWATLGAFIGFGSVWASEKTWATFHPSNAWILSVILGSGLTAAGPVLLRIWAIRRHLTRTNVELREQVEKDWSILTRRGWVGRLIRYSVAASVMAGTFFGDAPLNPVS